MSRDLPPPTLSDEAERALACFNSLLRAAQSIRGDLARQLRKFDLTLAQFAMMQLLYRRGHMTQGELAEELGVSAAEITHLVETLRKKRFVARQKRTKDRRYIVIRITADGKFLMKFAEPSSVRITSHRLEPLTPDEQEELIRMCERIVAERTEIPEEKLIDMIRDYEGMLNMDVR